MAMKVVDNVNGGGVTDNSHPYQTSYKPSTASTQVTSNLKKEDPYAVVNKAMADNSAIQNARWEQIEKANSVNKIDENQKTEAEPLKDVADKIADSLIDYSPLIEALAKTNEDKYASLKKALAYNKQINDDSVMSSYNNAYKQLNKRYNNPIYGSGLSNTWDLQFARDSALRQNESDYLSNLASMESSGYEDRAKLLTGLSNPNQETINKLLQYYK